MFFGLDRFARRRRAPSDQHNISDYPKSCRETHLLDRFYFVNYLPDPEEGTRRYHIHLTYPENNEWKELIAFRDYLKTHPEALQEYAELKKQAAQEANDDGERYRKLKEPMFKKVKKWNM